MTLLFALLASAASFAYIPEYSLIVSHTAEQHGKGGYAVEQEVTLRREGEPLTVRESWLVTNESQMRVTLEGKGALKGLVQGTMLYEGEKKFFIDGSTQRLMSQRLGEDWLEPFFYFRFSKWFRARLVNLRIAPAESLRDRPPMASDADPNYTPPNFIRLSRVGGGVAWAIGQAPSSSVPNPPAVWIEQDEFVVRKIHLPDQTVLKADDYNKFDENMMFPRSRTYNFGKATIEVRTLSVRPIGKIKGEDARFKNSSLVPSRDGVKFPEADTLKEFYSRFR